MTFEDIYGDTPMKVKRRCVHCEGYKVTYYYDVNNPIDRCIIDDYDKETVINITNTIKQTVYHIIQDLNQDKTKRVPYGMYYQHESVLKNIHDGIAFHTTSNEYESEILREGLIPGKRATCDVTYASLYIDKYKPKHVPFWMNRTLSVYVEPEFGNASLSPRKSDYAATDKSLFAVNLEGIDWGITSQAIGGFCLYYEDYPDTQLYEEWISNQSLKTNAKLYWKIYTSKEEYLNYSPKVKRIDNYYGLDEILVPQHIPAERVTLIGNWNNGQFIPSTSIRAFIKDNYKKNWYDILYKY